MRLKALANFLRITPEKKLLVRFHAKSPSANGFLVTCSLG